MKAVISTDEVQIYMNCKLRGVCSILNDNYLGGCATSFIIRYKCFVIYIKTEMQLRGLQT